MMTCAEGLGSGTLLLEVKLEVVFSKKERGRRRTIAFVCANVCNRANVRWVWACARVCACVRVCVCLKMNAR